MHEYHGGLRFDRSASAPEVLSEEYDATLDAIKAIYRRKGDGFYEVEFSIKGKATSDPQWSLPFWGNVAGQGIFGTLEDAQAHLRSVEQQYVERENRASG